MNINQSEPAIDNSKSETCFLCDVLYDKINLPSTSIHTNLSDDNLYKVLRDEIIESLSRTANARNWALVLLGGFTAICLNVYMGGSLNFEQKQLIVILAVLGGIFFTFQWARFASNAHMDNAEKGVLLLALEVFNNKHHWNEHVIWGLRLKERGITKNNWEDYKKKKFEFRLNTLLSDIFYNFYFLINSVYLGISLYVLILSPFTFTATLLFVISALFWLLTLLLIVRNNQDTYYYLKQADKFLQMMITKDPVLLDKRGISSMYGRSHYEL
jgi:hypothetical protein